MSWFLDLRETQTWGSIPHLSQGFFSDIGGFAVTGLGGTLAQRAGVRALNAPQRPGHPLPPPLRKGDEKSHKLLYVPNLCEIYLCEDVAVSNSSIYLKHNETAFPPHPK